LLQGKTYIPLAILLMTEVSTILPRIKLSIPSNLTPAYNYTD